MSLLGKKTIIALIVFAVISLAVTMGGIYYTKNMASKVLKNNEVTNTLNQNNTNQETISDNLGIKTLQDKYDQNDLLIINQKDHYGNKVEGENCYNWNLTYIKIKGLKNKNIEDKINQEIKQTVMDYIVKDASTTTYYSIDASCYANYSNTLSILIDNSYYQFEDENSRKYFNYDLNTGNQISFNDLFTNTASIKNMISKCAYNSIALQIGSVDLGTDMNKINYSTINDRVFKIMSEYNLGIPIKFYYTPREIYAYIAGENFTINMKDYYNNIAIYSRYASNKNLYDGSYEAEKNIYVFFDRTQCYYSKIENGTDNIYIDIKLRLEDTNATIVEEKYLDIIEKYKNYLNKQEQEYKNYLNENKDKAILFAVSATLSFSDEQNIKIYEEIEKFEMSKTYFATYKPSAIAYVQSPDSDEDVYEFTNPYITNNSSDIDNEYQQDERQYNLTDGTYTVTSHKYDSGIDVETIKTYKSDTDELISSNVNSSIPWGTTNTINANSINMNNSSVNNTYNNDTTPQ